jgi:hypothetical protein
MNDAGFDLISMEQVMVTIRRKRSTNVKFLFIFANDHFFSMWKERNFIILTSFNIKACNDPSSTTSSMSQMKYESVESITWIRLILFGALKVILADETISDAIYCICIFTSQHNILR